jgi:hypothetical protein
VGLQAGRESPDGDLFSAAMPATGKRQTFAHTKKARRSLQINRPMNSS